MTLRQRREYFYQNVSFCDANCTYIEVNYTSNTAICACEIKDGVVNGEILLEEDIDNENGFSYDDVISVINYKVFKCYKEVFDLKRLLVNVGNYTSLFFIIVFTICVIHFYINRKRNVMRFFQIMKERYNNEKKRLEKEAHENKEETENENNNESNNNKDIQSISNNSEEDKKDESYNKSIINIEDISVNDISNPPAT